MIDIAKLKVGDKVCYHPTYYGSERYENGMVKEIPDHTNESVRVVYHCDDEWDNFKEYTGALTYLRDLQLGWKY